MNQPDTKNCCNKCNPQGQDKNGLPNWQCNNPFCTCHQPPNGLEELMEELKRVLEDLEVADDFIPDKATVTFNRLALLIGKAYEQGIMRGLSQNGNITFEPKSEMEKAMFEKGQEAERQKIEKENQVWKAIVESNYEQKLAVETAKAILGERQRVKELVEGMRRFGPNNNYISREDIFTYLNGYNLALDDILNSLNKDL